jgi:predicted Zn-dependent protease
MVCLFVCSSGQNVDFENYSTLLSSGLVPDDFTTLSSEKYATDRGTISAAEKKRIRKTQEQFYLESNFAIDELLHSGRVIFGDPVTGYLNKVKDVLLKDEPELKSQIRIYTYKSTDANAFTANNGIVLVSTGLIAQVQNEAQIAFVLCHEFQHYVEKHAITSYVEYRQMERGSGIYKNLDPEKVNLERFRYSKDLESEADALGLTLFKKSQYSTKSVETTFDMLLYSYLPFDNVSSCGFFLCSGHTYFNASTFNSFEGISSIT